jgi:hypothetical protein
MLLNNRKLLVYVFLCTAAILLIGNIMGCGKSGNASPTGLNVRYRVLNLSPDLYPVNLYIDYKKVSSNPNLPVSTSNPFIFNVTQPYFYLPSLTTPFQFRTVLLSGATLLTRNDTLKSGLKYTVFLIGTQSDKTLTSIIAVDTAGAPKIGRGKMRFINVSPSETSGLDVYANGTAAFKKVLYKTISPYMELPVGNYDIVITAPGSTNVIKELPAVTIQDGRLYTIYAHGYTTRVDSAAFNADTLVNN